MRILKPFVIVLSVLSGLGLSACSSDNNNEDDKSIDKSLIVGTWECTHFEYRDKENDKEVRRANNEEFIRLTETFYEDGIKYEYCVKVIFKRIV